MLSPHGYDEGLACSENINSTKWKSSLLWYFLTDLGLELNGQITLPKVLYRTARHLPDKVALLDKQGGHYQPTCFKEILRDSEYLAAALVSLGIAVGNRVALQLKNCKEWVLSDFGTMDAGAVTVPLYSTLAASTLRQILQDSGASLAIVEDVNKLEHIFEVWKDCPSLKWIVVREVGDSLPSDPRILSFAQLLKMGKEQWQIHAEEIHRRREQASYNDTATIVYTSGTTGLPKGVMLTHRNILSNVLGVLSISEINEKDVALSILPLSHMFERTVGYYVPILTGATIAYAESFDTIVQNLQEIRPTYCAAVPRMFEKIYERIQRKIENAPKPRRQLLRWALSVGQELSEYREAQLSLKHNDRRVRHRPEDRNNHHDPEITSLGLKIRAKLARLLVYNQFKKNLGGRLKYFVSGGAPLRREICEFFRNLDIHIFEGYGLTETSPCIAFNYRNKCHPGTVGKLLPWIQLNIAADGELLVKGPNVMKGYFGNPSATAEVVDSEGWFHTGDIGYLDENNYLHITERKKEIIVMSNGKNVAPLLIESLLGSSPYVSQAVVLGNNHKYISALLVPNFVELIPWTRDKGLPPAAPEDLVEHPLVKNLFSSIVQDVNRKLSTYEQIKKYQLLPKEFTQEAGLVTPTLKLKRREIERSYADQIATLYQEPHHPIPKQNQVA